jgi:glycosyltransferase involved in cell wall biosynthesis
MVRPVNPVASVIIPTYNRAHLISRSIDSVFQQTFKDYEIIVIDDGSRDKTKEMLWERYGDQLVYIGKEKNEGLSAARNAGIKAARGKYLALLDDDDEWLPEKLEMQIALMAATSAPGLVYCNGFKVNEKGEVIGEIKGFAKGAALDALLSYNCLGPPSSVLLKKDVLEKIGCFDENLRALEDWDLWIRVAQLYVIDFVDHCLVKYRVHADNMSNNINAMKIATFAVLDKYWPSVCDSKDDKSRRNAVYSNHCVNFAWKEYEAGDIAAFKELMIKALEYDSSRDIFTAGYDVKQKETAIFGVFKIFWGDRCAAMNRHIIKRCYANHYLQFAWEYYHHGDMHNFRRCVMRVFQFTFPKLQLRLTLPYVKSFLGKYVSDAIHDLRIVVQRKHSNKNQIGKGFRNGIKLLCKWGKRYKSFLARRKVIRRYLAMHHIRKLHFGCGSAVLNNWLNTDLEPGDGIICVDVRRRLPFEDRTFDYIYSEHLLEHLIYQKGLNFIRECFRVLKPKGTMRIATPDLQFIIGLCSLEKTVLQERYVAWAAHSFIPYAAVCQDTHVINNFFHDWGHQFIYDYKTLEDTLKKAGFVMVRRLNVGESDDPELKGVESHHLVIPEVFNRLETMVVEATKSDTSVETM